MHITIVFKAVQVELLLYQYTCFCCRSGHLFHASSLGESTHTPGHVTLDGYKHANYSQQSFPSYRGQPFQQYNNMTSSYIRPTRAHHNGQPVWTNYSLTEPPPTTMGDGMPWGNFHAFILRIILSLWLVQPCTSHSYYISFCLQFSFSPLILGKACFRNLIGIILLQSHLNQFRIIAIPCSFYF